MRPGRYDLRLYRGDSYGWQFTLWEDPDMTIPVDLTNATPAAEIRAESAGTIYVTLAPAVIGQNTIGIKLSAAECQRCPVQGVWDLQLTFPDASVRTVVAGLVVTFPDVTDSVAAPALRR